MDEAASARHSDAMTASRPTAPDARARSAPPLSPRPLRRAWMVLTWERLQQAFWPAAALVGAALAVLLSGLPGRLPGWLHLGLLALLALTIVAALAQGLARWRVPRAAAVRRRLEVATPGAAHRPWTAATDLLALGAGDAASRRLWRAHQDRMAAAAAALRPGPARAGLATRDPLALRLVPLLFLAVALADAWPAPMARLTESLSPRFGPPAPPAHAQIWLTPPAYTGAAPRYLAASRDHDTAPDTAPETGIDSGTDTGTGGLEPVSATPLAVPEGSTVLALVRGGRGAARLDLGEAPLASLALRADGDGGQRLSRRLGRRPPEAAEATGAAPALSGPSLAAVDRLRLRQGGRVLIERPVTLIPDRPPSITWTTPPAPAGPDAPGRLALAYAARDDHGLARVTAIVAAAGGQALGTPPSLALPAVTGAARAEQPDLSAHPWAGTAVTITLETADALGQTAATAAAPVVLPERAFSHPLAQALIDIRRDLVRRPERARAAAVEIDLLAADTAAYDDRLAVFLSLKAASAGLGLSPDGLGTEDHLALLWSIASALEDGSLGQARRRLAEARDALREALAGDAGRAEVDRLAEALREAVARVMDTLAESLPLARLPMGEMSMPQGAEPFDSEAVERMLEQLTELSDLGARAAAEAMLERMERMLDQLLRARPPSQAEMRTLAEMAEMAARLRDLVERQQALHDQTFRLDPRDPDEPRLGLTPAPLPDLRSGETLEDWVRRQEAPTPAPAPPAEATRRLEGDQRRLRVTLESLMADLADRLDRVPQSLGNANLAMREAEAALRRGNAVAAAEAQGRALEALTEGQRQAMADMAGQGGPPGAGRGMGFGLLPLQPGGGWSGGPPGAPGMAPGAGRDPLDRPVRGGGPDDGSVALPTAPETRRAREILRELRRRANEADQRGPERDYLDRLLEPF